MSTRSDHGLWPFNDRFAWNFHLLTAPFGEQDSLAIRAHWLLPLVHGHVDQASKLASISLPFSAEIHVS